MADSTVIVNVAICHGSGSMHVGSVSFSLCRFCIYHYQGGAGNYVLGLFLIIFTVRIITVHTVY